MDQQVERAEEAAAGSVTQRHVFYVPGFDPLSPRRYRELYRREAAEQARISGYDIAIHGRRKGDGPYHWDVTAGIEGREVASRIEFLSWNDLVLDAIRLSIPGYYLLLWRTFWTYWSGGTLKALARLRREPMIPSYSPPTFLILYLIFGFLAGRLTAGALLAWAGAPLWLAVLAGIGAFCLFMWATKKADRRLFAYYMIADYGFTARDGGHAPAELTAR
ncbi:MAG: hypothetical protein AAFW69_06280, partial [Pseudomonadota bacterium]